MKGESIMRKFAALLLVLLFTIGAFAGCVQNADPVVAAAKSYLADLPEDKNMISVPELFEKMDAGEEMLIIDIRSEEDYAEGPRQHPQVPCCACGDSRPGSRSRERSDGI